MPSFNQIAALDYIKKGFPIIPLCWPTLDGLCGCGQNHQNGNIGKVPLTAHGLKDATQTILGVNEYWKKWPEANIAIVIPPGCFVLDVDINHNGYENLEELQKKIGNLPETWRITTGSGGCHLWFKTPIPIRNTVRLAGLEGLDIRGQGGYVVAPPSVHRTGTKYMVADEIPIANAPQKLVQLCQQRIPTPVETEAIKITEGGRNHTLASLGGTMRRRGMTEEAITAALLETNVRQCDPPLPEDEVKNIAKSVSRYKPEKLTNSQMSDISWDNLTSLEKTDETDKTEEKLTRLTSTDKCQENERTQKVWHLVDSWLPLHKNERFDLDTICRQLDVFNRQDRHAVVKKLSYEVGQKNLEKSDRTYRYINNEFTLIDWVNAPSSPPVPIKWPYGINDKTRFGFDGHVVISPRDIIIIAGVSNTGKTAFCLNLLWGNMDLFPCTLMGNEYEATKFKRRVAKMTWANPVNENGEPKFELIERHENWKDVIRPNNINIIDWINLGDAFYSIGKILEGIRDSLDKGIAVISLQKREGHDLAVGGGFSEDLASFYLAIDYERMTVRKAKEWWAENPNKKMYGFKLGEAGTMFSNIREVRKCYQCGGTGHFKMGDCPRCFGKGCTDV